MAKSAKVRPNPEPEEELNPDVKESENSDQTDQQYHGRPGIIVENDIRTDHEALADQGIQEQSEDPLNNSDILYDSTLDHMFRQLTTRRNGCSKSLSEESKD